MVHLLVNLSKSISCKLKGLVANSKDYSNSVGSTKLSVSGHTSVVPLHILILSTPYLILVLKKGLEILCNFINSCIQYKEATKENCDTDKFIDK